MIFTRISEETFEATTKADSGLIGTLAARIIDNIGGVTLPRQTTGITEVVTVGARSLYVAVLPTPSVQGQYTVVWDDGTDFAEEELIVASPFDVPPSIIQQSTRLEFVAPDAPDLQQLLVYEAPASTGPWTLIDGTMQVGTYPEYITWFTTDKANDSSDWFALEWVDSKGWHTALSIPIKGGTPGLVQQIVDRVLQRDRTLSESVVAQEAEAALEWFLDGGDPYGTSLSLTYRQLNGLTYLVLARALMARFVTSSNVSSASIGLVTMRSGVGATSITEKEIAALIEMANVALGIGGSVILHLEEVVNTYGQAIAAGFSSSYRNIPWVIVP